MKTVLLPVKGFDAAKQRLGQALSPAERSAFARAMLRDVLHAVSGSQSTDRRIVITASQEVHDVVRPFGFEVINEKVAKGHSAAVNRMTAELDVSGSSLLALASDLPTLLADEIDEVFAVSNEGLILIPSRDGTGTNGVFMRPGMRIEMDYGEGSLARHLRRADARGLPVSLLNIPGIQFDVDTPDDLEHLIHLRPRESEAWQNLCGTRFSPSTRTIP